MKYLENYKGYSEKMPIEDKVKYWIEYLDKNYSISVFKNMKTIKIEDKSYFLSDPFLQKSRLKNRLFLEIKYNLPEYNSDLHEPSLRKAIKIWIDKNSPLKENSNFDSDFDSDFAITKIQEQFPFIKVKEMLDKEVLEWTPEEEDNTYYSEHSNGEAEDAIITHLIDWYFSKYPSSYSEDYEDSFRESIQKAYNFLSY
jgi:hypothetical protein